MPPLHAAAPNPSPSGASPWVIVAMVAGACTLLPMLCCGGCLLEYGLRPKSEYEKQAERLDAAAQEFALPHLRKLGIDSLNDDPITMAVRGEILLIATGIDAQGKRHDVKVFINGTEDNRANWTLGRIDLDGKIGVNDGE